MSLFDDIDRALPYDDYLTVVRKGAGVQDPVTGLAAEAPVLTVLACLCDVQDDGLRLRRNNLGDAYRDADAVVYVPSAADLNEVREEDECVVEYAGVIQPGVVIETSRFERRILVRWK